ncbi:MAG: hypothetical protein COA57_11430 [Flavobacteriales bacterium]|nr:MAG: hypothetical protein COA57_11430 [Flavobacteriales bacterium]
MPKFKKYKLDKEKLEKLKRLREQDINRHKDFGNLLFDHRKAMRPMYKKPLYKDPKTFLALLLILLILYLLMYFSDKEKPEQQKPPVDTTITE